LGSDAISTGGSRDDDDVEGGCVDSVDVVDNDEGLALEDILEETIDDGEKPRCCRSSSSSSSCR
jgi:hypothetical protein